MVFLQIIVFILCIIIVHFIWNIFKEKFTIRKTKDLNTSIEKYKSIIEHNFSHNSTKNDINVSLEESESKLIESDLNSFLENIMLKEKNLVNNI